MRHSRIVRCSELPRCLLGKRKAIEWRNPETLMSDGKKYDVIVVGGGNAALCAALSARENGARVLLLERSPEEERGGNSSYTEGLMRFVYHSSDDIRALSPDLTKEEMESDFGAYTEDNF